MENKLFIILTQMMAMSIITVLVLLLICIGFLILLQICIVGKAFQRGLRTISRGHDHNNEESLGLSLNDLEKLPLYVFNGGEKESCDLDCVVCLESFEIGERCRLLPICQHSFHAKCVDSWLVKTPMCPICRTRVGLPVGWFQGMKIWKT